MESVEFAPGSDVDSLISTFSNSMNTLHFSKLRSAAGLVVAAVTMLLSVQAAAALTASYTTGAEVPVTAAGYTATGESVTFTLSYAPTAGTKLTVVENTGSDFINGTFDSLANGEAVDLSFGGITYHFVAWYYGGEGNNDLVLLWRDTALAAWGYNGFGELGDNSTTSRLVPVDVDQSGVLLGKTIVQVARGAFHSLALCSDGTVAAWGRNGSGQLGDNSYAQRNVPVAVNVADGTSALFGKTVIALVAGDNHSLALCSDGTLAGWGSNNWGGLGDNSYTARNVPVAVNAADGTSALFGKTVVAVAAGRLHSLALCSDGTVAAWGSNFNGELGDNSTTQRNVPVAVNVADGSSALFGKTVVAVSAGSFHSLALCSDGTVAAWGYNDGGQLGDNSTTNRNVPVAVNVADGTSVLFGKTVVALTAGVSHSLALCSDGTMTSWGNNGNGRLGDNSTTTRNVPVAVNVADGTSALFGKTVIALAAGSSHSLALCSDGTVAAWGSNFNGELGDNSTTQRLVPVAMNTTRETSVIFGSGRKVSRLSVNAAALYSLVIYGISPTPPAEIEVEVLEPAITTLTDNTDTVDFGSVIAAGRTFRVRNTGEEPLENVLASLSGPDAASFTLLGQPSTTVDGEGGTTTFRVAFNSASIGAKSATLQIASNDGDENPFRIPLVGTRPSALEATFATASDTPLSAPLVDLTGTSVNVTLNYAPSAGTTLTVIRNTGPAFIIGQFSNLANGELIHLSHGGQSYPFVVWYYGGDGNDLVLLARDTALAAWGFNGSGQLGDNSTTRRLVPVGVDQSGVLLDKTIVQVARGETHSLALCSDGTVAAWGANFYGQLGDNSTTQRNAPVAVNAADGTSALFGKTVVALAAGRYQSLALCSDGTVAAWGLNTDGQLGDNSTTQRNVPVAVNVADGTSALFGKTVVALAAGQSHSLALCSDGTVAAWGWNNNGQLGDNGTTTRRVPVAVNVADGTSALFGKTVVALAAGQSHSLALCSDGTVATWGWNDSGRLGDNSTTQRNVPVAVNVADGTSALFGKTVVALAAGQSHSLALCSDGTVAAWGANDLGQLGDNGTTQRNAPVAVNVADGTSALFGKTVVALATGSIHNLAMCSDGTVAAWGHNFSGQLGDNSQTDRLAPVDVTQSGILSGSPVISLGSSSATASHSLALYSASPEIVVEQPSGIELTDGTSVIDFGTAVLSSAGIERTFTVRNTGLGALTDLAITFDGTNAADFTVTSPPASLISPGGSATFTVRFSSTEIGAKTAALHLASNDDDENPFDISLVGSAISTLTATYVTGAEVPLTTPSLTATGLTVDLTLSHTPTPGTTLTLVENTGVPFIDGTFSNLANGEVVNLSYDGTTYPFVAWYYGGDGNDLVLRWRATAVAAWGNGGLVPVGVEQSGVLQGKTVVQLARGGFHSLALCSDGTLAAWGFNLSGQLGDNSTTFSGVPVNVNLEGVLAGKTVVAVAAGRTHSLALCSDGTVAAWGSNEHGQLGDNSTTDRLVPVAVNVAGGTSALFGKTVVALAAGQVHSLALCSDGTVAAWGYDSLGVLGNGGNGGSSQANPSVPVAVDMTGVLSGKVVVALAAGSFHNLVLCSDGTMAAWGGNGSGQLGDNSTTTRLVPVAVNMEDGTSVLFGKTVVALAAGESHSLAACSDGTVAAWGGNDTGQLGDNSTTQRNAPVAVNVANGTSALFGKTVVALAAGENHNLAACGDGALVAWGLNDVGQIGDNSTTQRNAPVDVTQSGVFSGNRVSGLANSMGSSANHSLALYTGPTEIVVEQPAGIELTDGTSVIDFGTTVLSSAGVERTFTVRNTGLGALTDLAITFDGTHAGEFTVIIPPAAEVLSGESTNFTVRFSSTAIGAKTAALHLSSNDDDESPFDISLAGSVISTVNATYVTGAEVPLTTSGLTATGLAVNLTLGYAPEPGTALTVVSLTGPNFIEGTFSNLANGEVVNLSYGETTYPFVAWYYGGDGNDFVLLWRDTALAAWGDNEFGQLGENSTTQRTVPVGVDQSGVLRGKTIVQVARGALHSLALCSDGTVAAWGDNEHGQLGDNSMTLSRVPVNVNLEGVLAGKTVVAVAAGGWHNLALCSDGTVAAWGGNQSGELGDNSTTDRLVPVAVNMADGNSALLGKTVIAIAGGGEHSLALCSDGTVAAWGRNNFGGLGDNSTTNRLLPVAVNVADGTSALFGKTVIAIAGGGEHSLALCSDGTVAAWGWNDSGRLGDNSTTDRQVPVAVNVADGTSALFGKTVIAVSAGGFHSLALCSDGTVAAWGYNDGGQLGDNSTTERQVPVAVNVADGTSALFGKTVIAVAAGGLHSLALCSDGTVAAWGKNFKGQLGDNSTTQRLEPVAVNVEDGTSELFGKRVSGLSGSSTAAFSLAVYGAVLPEISVEQPVSIDLTDGSATVDFGTPALVGSVIERTFTVRNAGPGELIDTAITFDGSDASDYTVTSPPATLVVPGGSTTFTVRFTPSSIGAKTADLHLASTDADENPFDITLFSSGATETTLTNSFISGSDVPLTVEGLTATGNTVDLALNFAPTQGANLMVVNNTGQGSIGGAFDNLANGEVTNLSFGGKNYPFVAWYYGGDGNDLVLLWRGVALVAWGGNASGQIGDNSTVDRAAPAVANTSGVLAGKTIVELATGDSHSLALCTDGTLAAWGDNAFGQLGDNSTTSRSVPVLVDRSGALSGKTVIAIAAGGMHSLALCSDGTVTAWGSGQFGQIGDSFTNDSSVPVLIDQSGVLTGKAVIAIAAGFTHNLALCEDGTLVSWGNNELGTLGNDNTTDSAVPVLVDQTGVISGKTVVAIAAGGVNSLALCSDGTLASWGSNTEGALGDSNGADSDVPVLVDQSGVLAGKTIASISAGDRHNLVLCSDGTLVSWGFNTASGSTPSAINQSGVLSGKTVTEIIAGNDFSVVLCDDGALAAWGLNDLGQLGDSTINDSLTPVPVDQSSVLASGLLRSLDIAGSGSSAAHNLSVYSIPVKVGDPNAALRAFYLNQIKKFKKKAKKFKKKKKVAKAKKFKKKAKSFAKKLAAL